VPGTGGLWGTVLGTRISPREKKLLGGKKRRGSTRKPKIKKKREVFFATRTKTKRGKERLRGGKKQPSWIRERWDNLKRRNDLRGVRGSGREDQPRQAKAGVWASRIVPSKDSVVGLRRRRKKKKKQEKH